MRRVAGCAGALAAADFAAAYVVSVGVRARVVSMPAACGGRLFSVMSSASSCSVSGAARKNVGESRGAVARAYEQGRVSSGCREWGPGVGRVMRELVGLSGSSTLPLCFSSRVHEHVGPSGARALSSAAPAPAPTPQSSDSIVPDVWTGEKPFGRPGRKPRAAAVEEEILHKAPHHNIPRARAVRKRFKTSVKKLNLVCKLVRRCRVDAALMQLSLNSKRVAVQVRKTIYDAKFNAANNHGMDPDRLLVDEIIIGRSTYLKRIEFKGRGKTGVRKKPFCYMAVYVREIQDTDQFVNFHLKRRRPRWKSGPIKS